MQVPGVLVMLLRAVLYAVGGERVGVLPDDLGLTVTVPRAGTPTLKMTYPMGGQGVRGDALSSQAEIAVEASWDGGVEWLEPPGARFRTLQSDDPLITDGTDSRSVDAVHVSARLGQALVWSAPVADDQGARVWSAATPGGIIRALWDEAAARGWGAGDGLSIEGTGTADAAGTPWPEVVTTTTKRSASLEDVVSLLQSMGVLDTQWAGRTLRLLVPDTPAAGRDLSGSVQVRLAHSTAAPERTSWADLCTDVLVTGEGGVTWVVHNDRAPSGMPRTEVALDAGGVTSAPAARLAAAALLESGASPAQEVTRTWDAGEARVLPWRDYAPGDRVSVERATGLESMRVTQVSVTRRPDGGTEGHLTCGTRLAEALERIAARSRAGGSQAVVGARPSAPAPESTMLVPRAPQGLVASTTTVLDSAGYLSAVMTAGWSPVTLSTSGVSLTGSQTSYEVGLWRTLDGGASVRLPSVTADSTSVQAPVTVGFRLLVRVRCVCKGVAGAWSASVALTVEATHSAPAEPSVPAVSSTLGVLTVKWDGRMLDGSSPPTDVEAAEVSVVAPGADPSRVTEIGGRSGGSVQVPTTAGGQYDVSLRLRDRQGLLSAWTTPLTVTATSAIDSDALARMLEEGDALNKAAKAAAADQAAGLNTALTQVAAALAPGTEYPPDDGVEGVTLWVSPGDGKVWRLKRKVSP